MNNPVPTALVQTTTATRPLARALALVALLCVGALQLQEAGHGHWFDQDDSAHCLVCKNSAGTAVAAELPCEHPLGIAVGTSEPALAAPTLSEISPFLARGPPIYS